MQGLVNLHAGLTKCPEGFEAGTKSFLTQTLRLNTDGYQRFDKKPVMRPSTEAFFTQRLVTYAKNRYLAGQMLVLKHKSVLLYKQIQPKSYFKILCLNDKSKEPKPHPSL